MVRSDNAGRRPNRDRQKYDEFRETLSTPMPNQTYRSEVEHIGRRASIIDRIIRYASVVLSGLLAIRFVIALLTANVDNPLIGFFRITTDWIVSPFQAVLGISTPAVGGFFDWPTLAALIVVVVIAMLLLRSVRPRDTY
jgi:hypothetical protein